MGYDSQVVTKTLEYYIQEIQLHRDSATCTVYEALGELTPSGEVNAAGQQYHMPESNTRYDFTVADMVAAGIAPATILSLDNQVRQMAEQMVAWAKAKAAAVPVPSEPVAPETSSTEG
jgi:hypothetical protein